MSRFLILIYGVLCHLMFLAVAVYAVGFLANAWVPKSIDSGSPAPLGWALGINLALLAVFGIQHSVMARPAFKRWWHRIVPPPAERSTYVLASNLALILIFWLWQPMPQTVWHVDNPASANAVWVIYGLGWAMLVATTFVVDHFDLFGLRQVWFHFRGREYRHPEFTTRFPYNTVRHPLMTGWLVIFWATPDMSLGHLVFALGTTAYILVGIVFEQNDLREFIGERYRQYCRQVPALIPRPWPTRVAAADSRLQDDTRGQPGRAE